MSGLVAVLLGCAVALLLPARPAPLSLSRVPSRPMRSRTRAEERRRKDARQDDLPHLVGLVALGVRSGAPVPQAVLAACDALPSPGAAPLRGAAEAVERGADPERTWDALDDHLAKVGRALARSARTGASVVRTLDVLADDLAEEQRAAHEDRARSVGVRAAVPLGVCLLPAFVLLGIVPLIAGMASGLLRG
ncbi:type II secretion system F family protein [Nocardioides yefusunii]|uniref:Type II secretion system F family protein n=1 Tax=Nocardioides yefusunii TaxID=2500546 RepID=A0ABW1QXB8_9ACTN|nr:type II secretion system F family protein [Nocardioides yefusunii]